MEINSERNQEIKRQFVEREVVYCVSSLIYELSKDEKYMEEMMDEGILSVPDYESAVDSDRNIHVQWSESLSGYVWVNKESHEVSDPFNDEADAYRDAIDTHQLDYDYKEAYEHWIVSDFLARKLKDHGEMIGNFMGLTIWGRTITGQAIMMDGVISKICEENN